MRTTIFLCAILVLFNACKTPNIMISNDLRTNTSVFDVKGRQGWQFNQVITYGNYSTSKIKRGWALGYDIPFVLRFKKAEEKLSFIQTTAEQKQADVLAVGKFKSSEFSLLDGFISYAVKYENVFTGCVVLADDRTHIWEFIIHNPEASLPQDADCGIAKDTKGNEITIRGIKKIEGQANWIQLDNYGFEFIQNHKVIGAVSTLNNGRVWFKEDISSDQKLIIASISTSLLVRHSMQDSFSK